MLLQDLRKKNLIQPPSWLDDNTLYLTLMGSVAYGVSSDTSDMDIYGFCVPPRTMVFPHLEGEIQGFGRQKKRFEYWQQHGVKDETQCAGKGRVYDFSVYSIVRYFSLVMENNPNMIDSLFTEQWCVQHSTKVANMVRDKRKDFLHKGCWHKFKGYAYGQIAKIRSKTHVGLEEVRKFEEEHNIAHTTTLEEVREEAKKRELLDSRKTINENALQNLTDEELREYHSLYEKMVKGSKRAERVKIQKFDVKFAYHVVRLLYEAEMILAEQDLDLMRHREHLKSIRRGEVSEQEILEWASAKEKDLEKLYAESKLRHSPDEPAIKALLLECLEEHYGTLSDCIVNPDAATVALRQIQEILERTKI